MIGRKKSGLASIMMLQVAIGLLAQEVVFFTDGTDDNFYDQGIVDVAELGESFFEYTHPPDFPQYNDKIPCSTNAYAGSSSLKFNYTSSPDGSWLVKVFRKDWSAADITGLDSLSFYLYSADGLPVGALPLIGIHASASSGGGEIPSSLYALADYNGEVPAAVWTRIVMPLDVILEDADNDALNFTESRAVIFAQSETDNSSRLFMVDEIRAFKALGDIPTPLDFTVTGYDSHAELSWVHPVPDLNYIISASFDGGSTYEQRLVSNSDFFMDFVSEENRNKTITYRIVAAMQGKESEALEKTVEIRDFSDDELLDMVERYAFRYFWEGAHQATGMALERSNGNGRTVASGATGMGLLAMIAAHEREYEPLEEVKDRILKILDFLETCDRHHGAWSHWYNGNTGETQPFSTKDDGGDLVETAYVVEGLIGLKHYFTGEDAKSVQIREKADLLWKGVEWDWYRQGGQNILTWHWSPNYGWDMNMKVRGWNECLATYILAAASPDYGIPAEVYTEGWTRNGDMYNKRRFYEENIYLSPNWGGPMFWIHYAHLGIDPRGLTDDVVNYWEEYRATSMIHYKYAIENPKGFKNYSEDCWGLTASDDPYGYTAHKPWDNDNGTVSPTAALGSMPYTPVQSMKALKYFYRERGSELFGKYGPYDAFNDQVGWIQEAYIGIDQGPIAVMIENHRTGLLWDLLTMDADVQAGIEKLGFWYEPIDAVGPDSEKEIGIYPNPGRGLFTISLPGWEKGTTARVGLYSMDGQLLRSLDLTENESSIDWTDLQPGIYLLRAGQESSRWHAKILIQ